MGMQKLSNLNDVKILSSLTSGAKYGLEIIEDVKQAGTFLFLGSLYNALNRLEKEGFVESYWGDETAERGGNRRRYYKLTAQGDSAIEEIRVSFATMWNLKLAFNY